VFWNLLHFCWHVGWLLLLLRCAYFALGFRKACEILWCRYREVEEFWLLECDAVQSAAVHWHSGLLCRKSPHIPTNRCRISKRSHSVAFHETLIFLDETAILKSKLIFRRVHNIAKSDCYLRHFRPSVHMEHLGSRWTDFHKVCYLRILWKMCREKIKFH
jgi:hypothetical protein